LSKAVEIIAADIGNTSMTIAAMRGLDARLSFDVSSQAAVQQVHDALEKHKVNGKLPLVIASVNPRGDSVLELAWRAMSKSPITVLGRDKMVPIPNKTRPPEKTGQDRLVNALAARERCGKDAIVVDFGTAITFDVLRGGAYEGGVITPGIGLAMEALHQKTALLPLVHPKGKPPVVGHDTVSAINAGVFYGYIGLVENILREILKTYKKKPTVLATGGYGAHIAPQIKAIDEVVPHLTHEGIALAWQD
jgi:type III pantothenate kinase